MREAFEGGQLAVVAHRVVVPDAHGGDPATAASRVHRERGETVGVPRIPYGRPRRVLARIDRRTLLSLWRPPHHHTEEWDMHPVPPWPLVGSFTAVDQTACPYAAPSASDVSGVPDIEAAGV